MERPKLEVADIFRRYGEAYREKHGASMSTAQRRVMTAIEVCRTCGSRRTDRTVRSVRPPTHLLPLLPKSPLPKVSIAGSRRVDPTPPRRTSRLRVLPRCLHGAGRDCRDRLPEQGGGLRHSLPGHGRNLTDHCCRPQTPGCRDRLLRRAPQLGVEPAASPAPALRSPRRRPLTRRYPLDLLQARLLLARARVVAPVPPLLSGASPERLRCRQTAVLHRSGKSPRAPRSLLVTWRRSEKPNGSSMPSRPLLGPQQVLDYVGRYTHRVAISNNRLLDIEDGQVRFQWKDYRDNSQQKTMTLSAEEFIRRFLLHALPDGFQRIRYYGLLGNRYRQREAGPLPPITGHGTSA